MLLFAGDALHAVIVLDLHSGRWQVRGMYSVASPDKPSHID
jgi:hypothetical protein